MVYGCFRSIQYMSSNRDDKPSCSEYANIFFFMNNSIYDHSLATKEADPLDILFLKIEMCLLICGF